LTRIAAAIARLDTLRGSVRQNSLHGSARSEDVDADKVAGVALISRRAGIC